MQQDGFPAYNSKDFETSKNQQGNGSGNEYMFSLSQIMPKNIKQQKQIEDENLIQAQRLQDLMNQYGTINLEKIQQKQLEQQPQHDYQSHQSQISNFFSQQQNQIIPQKDRNLLEWESKIRDIIKSKASLSNESIKVTITKDTKDTKDGSDRVIISISGLKSGSQVKFTELLKGKKELYNKLSNAKSGTKSISIETKNLREIVDLLEKNARTQWGDKHLKNKTQQFQKY